jgi:hypothetical protein
MYENMKKYRILHNENEFIIQIRWFFFWGELFKTIDGRFEIFTFERFNEHIRYGTKKECLDLIEEYKRWKSKKYNVIWEE